MAQGNNSNTLPEKLVVFPLTKNLVCMLPEDDAEFLYEAWKTDMSEALAYDFEDRGLHWCEIWHG